MARIAPSSDVDNSPLAHPKMRMRAAIPSSPQDPGRRTRAHWTIPGGRCVPNHVKILDPVCIATASALQDRRHWSAL
eukprot:scaffold770_cov255-Pinguiococcus_pyrenoidosus.AAC.37